MDEASLVAERAVRADENLLRYRLTENLHLQSVCEDLLRLLRETERKRLFGDEPGGVCVCVLSHSVEVRVDQRHIVIAGDDVPQSGQPLLHSLDPHCIWQTVPDVLQLLVCRVVRHQKAVAVTWRQEGNRKCSSNR